MYAERVRDVSHPLQLCPPPPPRPSSLAPIQFASVQFSSVRPTRQAANPFSRSLPAPDSTSISRGMEGDGTRVGTDPPHLPTNPHHPPHPPSVRAHRASHPTMASTTASTSTANPAELIARSAKEAFDAAQLLEDGAQERVRALRLVKEALQNAKKEILEANQLDMDVSMMAQCSQSSLQGGGEPLNDSLSALRV